MTPNSIVLASKYTSRLTKCRKLAKLLPKEGRNFRKTTPSRIFQTGVTVFRRERRIEFRLDLLAGQVRAEGVLSARRRVAVSGSCCENPIATEMARAAELTAPANAATWLGLTLVTGPDTLTAAIGSRSALRIGALTQRAPCTASSSSTAYPCRRIFSSS